ncbi:MAG TPA: DUF6152 family protein [Azospirillaceae bacterium]|nr:DUF6152 family protein [Azospirillaceae bacterium]
MSTILRSRRALLAAVVALPALVTVRHAVAHHGWGGYVPDPLRVFDGTVRSVRFVNPHAEIDLEAAGQTLRIVLAPPSRMTARGLPDGTLQAGQTVQVQGYPSREDPREVRAERIVVAGRPVELR